MTVKLDRLVMDPRCQPRKKIDVSVIRNYANAYKNGTDMPPLTVARIGKRLILVDGWHRVSALRMMGATSAKVTIIKAEEQELAWLAAKANLSHGMALKSGEIRIAFNAYIEASQHICDDGSLKSYRAIASDIGGSKSHSTIRNWMKEDFSDIFKKMAEQSDEDTSYKQNGGLRDTYHDDAKIAAAGRHIEALKEVTSELFSSSALRDMKGSLEAILSLLDRKLAKCPIKSDDSDDIPF